MGDLSSFVHVKEVILYISEFIVVCCDIFLCPEVIRPKVRPVKAFFYIYVRVE